MMSILKECYNENETCLFSVPPIGFCRMPRQLRDGGVERELDAMIPKIGVEYTPPLWKNLFDKVNACTNAADRKAASQSPEMRAIWRGEVAPAKFARDSDPPVGFPPFEVPMCETNVAATEVEVDI